MQGVHIVIAFLGRDWRSERSYRLSFGLGIVGQLFGLVLYFYISKLVDPSRIARDDPGLVQGYFAFAVLGIMTLEVMNFALTTFSSRMQEEQIIGTLEALLATPANPALLILASSTFGFLRTIAGLFLRLVLAIAVLGLTFDTGVWPALAALVALIGGTVVFAALGIIIAGLAVVWKRISAILGWANTVIALLGGVYFPVDLLPAPVRLLAHALPLTWTLDVVRAALLTQQILLGRLVLIVAVACTTMPFALRAFSALLDHARRDGSLGQY